jgi:hypothetical protein
MSLSTIDPTTDERWDRFVDEHPAGCIYHHSAWARVLAQSFGYTPFYMARKSPDSREVKGIVPFMLVERWLTGKKLVSLPLTAYCTPLLPDNSLDEVVEFVRSCHVDSVPIELKVLPTEDRTLNVGSLAEDSSYVTHILEIDREPDELMKLFHGTSVRQRIRRASRENLSLRMASSESDLKHFHRLLTGVRKKHGLPPHPYLFFRNMWRILGPLDMLRVPMIEHAGEVVSAAIVLKYKDTFHFEYSATSEAHFHLCPNQMLIWETIKMAFQEGARFYDFGRSTLASTSLIEFKERWKAKRYPLMYLYYPDRSKDHQQESSPRKVLETVNRHLPESLLRLEGQFIYKHIN